MGATYKQFLFSTNPMLTYLEGSFAVGASGSVTGNVLGTGISTVTKLSTGTYQIQLLQNFNRIVGSFFELHPAQTGSNVNAGSFVTNTTYQIVTLGTTNWNAIGLASGLTAAVNQCFVATGAGSGNGVAIALGTSGIDHVEMLRGQNLMLYPANTGAYILFQTVLAGAVANPTNGAAIRFGLMLRNSSLLGTNETPTN
jgi:hypothetical protein